MPNILQRILADDRFSARTLTKLVLEEDYAPGQIMQMGIFEPIPVTTTQVSVEHLAGRFSIVPTTLRGEAPTPYLPEKRKARDFTVPHIAQETLLKADYLQNMRAIDGGDDLETVQAEIVRRLGGMARNNDGTIEHKLAGALRGVITDADGSTLIDLFAAFDVTPPDVVAMDLTAADPDPGAVKRQCNGVVRSIGDALGNATPRAYVGFCGPEYFDDFTCNGEVAKAFERYTDAGTDGTVGAFNRESQVRQRPFKYGGIYWEEYRGGEDFIDDDEAIVFPIGVPDLYQIYYAPADFLEYVNTLGMPRYAKVWQTDNAGRSLTAHCQTNPCPIVTRPGVLRRLKRGAA